MENHTMIDKLARLREQADARMRAMMPSAEVDLAARMSDIRARHCTMARDTMIEHRISAMKRSLVFPKGQKKSRILFVTGEANSGKTNIVEHAILRDPAFRPYQDAEGTALPLLYSQAPSPCTQRNLALRLIKTTGFPIKADTLKSRAWPALEEQIRAHRARFIVLDEAQRAMKVDSPQELQELSDNLISLVDALDWPVRLILIGVDPLDTLRTRDSQMEERSLPVHLGPIPDSRTERVETWLDEIVLQHAGLTLSINHKKELARRLVHACAGNNGSIIEFIMSAVEVSLIRASAVVELAHFAQAYHELTGCLPHDNVFEAASWKKIPAGAAKIKVAEEEEEDDIEHVKPLKPGERPQ